MIFYATFGIVFLIGLALMIETEQRNQEHHDDRLAETKTAEAVLICFVFIAILLEGFLNV